VRVVSTALHRQRTLTRGWQHVLERDCMGALIREPQTNETCSGENDGVVFTVPDLCHTRIDVPAQRSDLEVPALQDKLRAPPHAAGAHAGASMQISKRATRTGDENVARVNAKADSRQDQPRSRVNGHVLERMHRVVDLTCQQRSPNSSVKTPRPPRSGAAC
jgi:hypothetical protein